MKTKKKINVRNSSWAVWNFFISFERIVLRCFASAVLNWHEEPFIFANAMWPTKESRYQVNTWIKHGFSILLSSLLWQFQYFFTLLPKWIRRFNTYWIIQLTNESKRFISKYFGFSENLKNSWMPMKMWNRNWNSTIEQIRPWFLLAYQNRYSEWRVKYANLQYTFEQIMREREWDHWTLPKFIAQHKKKELKLVDIDKLMATIQTDEKNNNGEIVDVIVCSRRISIYAFLITYLQ